MPCMEIFDAQPMAYRVSIFPPNIPVLSIEVYHSFGWAKYAHASVSLDRFGMSAPAKVSLNLNEHFVFSFTLSLT